MKNLTYVLDIGSSKISLLACCVSRGKSAIVTSIDKHYDGFMDGEFFSTEQLSQVIKDLIEQMSARLHCKITIVHIGVPSEFSACVCKRVTRNFVPAKKITNEDIASMFDGVDDFSQSNEYLVTSFSPLQYEIDGNVVSELSSKRVSQFSMDCSYILVKKQFVDCMQQIFNDCGISEIDFVSTALAQSQFAMRQMDNKLSPIIVIDIGHITTSVAVAKGEGLLMLSSFSLGGGHITADLMQVNNLSYNEADAIKRKVCLTIQSKRDDRYIVYEGDKQIKSLINSTNDIVKARIENIASVANKVLEVNPSFSNLPIYLTGDGVSNFRGIVNLFEAVTNHKVHMLKSPLHNDSDKFQTSKISLVQIIKDLI